MISEKRRLMDSEQDKSGERDGGGLLRVMQEGGCFCPLTDKQAARILIKRLGYTLEGASWLVGNWRLLSRDLGHFGVLAWMAFDGFKLGESSPEARHLHDGWEYFANATILNNDPTSHGLVFFVPSIIEESRQKMAEAQLALLAEIRKNYGLPKPHLTSFGSPNLLAGLTLAHAQAFGGGIFFPDDEAIRTDAINLSGHRYVLGRKDDKLLCHTGMGDDDDELTYLGCCALGVEVLPD